MIDLLAMEQPAPKPVKRQAVSYEATIGRLLQTHVLDEIGPDPTGRQYSQGPGTQRKTSPSIATWQTDGNDRWVATSDSRFAASSRRRRSRTRAASSGSCSKPLYQSGCSNPT